MYHTLIDCMAFSLASREVTTPIGAMLLLLSIVLKLIGLYCIDYLFCHCQQAKTPSFVSIAPELLSTRPALPFSLMEIQEIRQAVHGPYLVTTENVFK